MIVIAGVEIIESKQLSFISFHFRLLHCDVGGWCLVPRPMLLLWLNLLCSRRRIPSSDSPDTLFSVSRNLPYQSSPSPHSPRAPKKCPCSKYTCVNLKARFIDRSDEAQQFNAGHRHRRQIYDNDQISMSFCFPKSTSSSMMLLSSQWPLFSLLASPFSSCFCFQHSFSSRLRRFSL